MDVYQPVAAKHTGIYGIITVPSFRITGYDEGGDTDIDKALGVPMLPGYNTLSSFPTSGTVEIGDLWVTYDGIINMSAIRGPFQFRQLALYEEPFGNGSWGLHLRDHAWEGGPNVTAKLLGSDDGYVYKVEGVKWNVFITTGGNADRPLAQVKVINGLGHQAMNRAGVASRAEMKGNIP